MQVREDIAALDGQSVSAAAGRASGAPSMREDDELPAAADLEAQAAELEALIEGRRLEEELEVIHASNMDLQHVGPNHLGLFSLEEELAAAAAGLPELGYWKLVGDRLSAAAAIAPKTARCAPSGHRALLGKTRLAHASVHCGARFDTICVHVCTDNVRLYGRRRLDAQRELLAELQVATMVGTT